MNSTVYQKILKENVRPSVRQLKLKRSWVLQQDNDPKHTSKSTSEWLKKNKMKTLEWPSQSPDLNPIEMLWHDLKKAVHARKPSNKAELQQFCKDEEYPCIIWTGGSRKVPMIMFHAEAILQRELSLCAAGERYRLSYKIVRTDSRLIRRILSGHGFQEVNANSNDFNIMWTGSHIKPYILRNLASFQKVNHFPRQEGEYISYELTRKDCLYRNVQRMQQSHGIKNFHLLPQTYLLPTEYQDFCNNFSKDRGPWIVKPVASSRGRGVYLINSPSQISMEDNILVSRYISNPLLIDGFKFDVRLYVLLTSYEPLVIYLYEEGLTRFATAKYDRTAKNIKNQFMHLTNYSVNKKSEDYVSCEDPEVEDYGNKWSMSAMLRYLKQHGKDTTALMSQVEDLVIKTIIAAELPIASACKSFLSNRGNCFELYGFDVLIDVNLKPWLLEVNLSPSLACDAPLDLKIKASMISDMFTLIGVECQDPQQRVGHVGSSVHNKRTQKPMCPRPLSASDIETGLQGGGKSKVLRRTSCTLGLSVEEVKILRRVQDENERRGGFVRIFPRHDTWQLYGCFLEYKTSLNYMLATHLFPNKSSVNVYYENSWDSKIHAALYERKLVPLHLRRARRRGLKQRAGLVRDHHCSDHEQSCSEQEDGEQSEDDEEIESEQDQPLPSSDSAKIELPPPLPCINLMDILQKGTNMSKVQARDAFACYLKRVRSRLLTEKPPETVQPKEEEQMDLVMRFLRRAAGNLQKTLSLSLPARSVPSHERRNLLAKLLGDFVDLYNQETEQMRSDETENSEINSVDFQAFVANSSENELEEVLTFYTQKNKSASVFLGPSSNANRSDLKNRPVESQDNATLESSVFLSKNTNQKLGNKLATVPGYNTVENHVVSSDSVVDVLPDDCFQRGGASAKNHNDESLFTISGGCDGNVSTHSKLSVTPGVWAHSVTRPQSSSFGTFSSFQSAAQIYSQKLSRPRSTNTASNHHSPLRTRCGSAGVIKDLDSPYNESTVVASIQRLAGRPSSQQYSRQLRLLTQQLTNINIKEGAFGKGRFQHGLAANSTQKTANAEVETIESITREKQSARTAWECDINNVTFKSEVPLQNHQHQMQYIPNQIPYLASATSSIIRKTSTLLPTPPSYHKQTGPRIQSASRIVRVGSAHQAENSGSTLINGLVSPLQGSTDTSQIIFARARPPILPNRTTDEQRNFVGKCSIRNTQ
ncbi:hypothetical protein GDO86_015867 [Hymenochirus boettgeri]|uniref:Tubulin--tyrosine ligase-like protein 5 n=1 Tax=Hymenochirus boettgeri TaxID=247094 RepID=A0A8T2JUQ3_9PIPI|nr:hypothetical protein GDO86_015867 [Hymenochirus boettgeri]